MQTNTSTHTQVVLNSERLALLRQCEHINKQIAQAHNTFEMMRLHARYTTLADKAKTLPVYVEKRIAQ